jgi:predicted exporter
MKSMQYAKLSILLILPLLLLLTFFKNFTINTNILTSLNRNYFEQGFSTAFEKYEASLSSDLVILLKGGELDSLGEQAKSLDKILNDSGLFKLEKHLDNNFKELGAFFYKHHQAILTPDQIAKFDNGQVAEIKQDALKQIYSPFGSALSTLTIDPFVLVPGFFADFAKPVELTPYGRYFKTNEVENALILRRKILAGKETSALSFLEKIELKNTEIKLSFSSMGFYGVRAKTHAINESNTFSLLTILLILIIFYRYFRSFRHLLLSLSSIIFCTSIGLFITGLVFGGIHLMSLLMGISILGIMADYFIHYFIKEGDAGIHTGITAFRSIQKPLVWSFITSLIGFLIFSTAPLPLLKEFGVFSISSLFFAVLIVRYGLTTFYKKTSESKKDLGRLSGINEKIITRIVSKKIKVWTLIPIFICFMCILLFKNSNNDIRSFSTPDESLRIHEEEIKKSINYKYGYEFFIVRGEKFQDLLESEERLKSMLKKDEIKASFLTHYLPSEKTQNQSIETYKAAHPEMVKFLKRFKMKPNSQALGKTFELSDLVSKFPDFDVLKQYIGEVDNKFYSIVPIYLEPGTLDHKSLQRKYESKNTVYMNKLKFINEDVSLFSTSITYGLIIFSFVFFIILGFKFGVTNAGAIIFPSLVSILSAIGLVQVFGVGINIFHLLGAVLIFALGLDYSFFYFFNRKSSELTRSSIELSTLTTISSFGVLALSSTHAVSSFGMTVFIGIISCYLWSPFSHLGAKHV